jgi:hypothetical protein
MRPYLRLILLALLVAIRSGAGGIPEPDLIFYGDVRNNLGGQNIPIRSGTLSWTFRPSDAAAPVILTLQLTNVNDQFSYVVRVPCETSIAGQPAVLGVLRLTSPALTYTRTNVTLNGNPVFLKDPSLGQLPFTGSQRGLVQRVDLAFAAVDPDADGDGLPDWWETLYPGAGNPDVDADGDGLNNRKEYLAGTHPLDAQSVFEFIRVTPDPPDGVWIEWSSSAGRTYTLLRASFPSPDAADYALVRSGLLATPPVSSYRDTIGSSGETWFYRVRVDE